MAFAAFGSGTAAGADAAPLKRSTGLVLLLLAPGLAYLALFFLAPLVSLVITSVGAHVEYPAGSRPVEMAGWETYAYAMQTYWPQILRAFVFALVATVLGLLISYPIAYFIGVTARNWPIIKALALVLVIAPFFISFLLRTWAWLSIFGSEGWASGALHAIGILGPDQTFKGTPGAVIFGLTYNFIPFMTLPLFTTLDRLDQRYLEAGADLYASPWTRFWKVTFPLSLPGVVSGTLLTFIPAAGDYVNASQVFFGGPKDTSMVGNAIEGTFLAVPSQPELASALSVILMAIVLVIIAVYTSRTKSDDLL